MPLALFLVTCALFAPALGNQLLNWDDGTNFVKNPHFRGLGGEQLTWMWTTFHMGPYQPLSWMTLAVDYLVWGTDAHGRLVPTGFYLTNILLHALNVVFVYFLGRRLLSRASYEAFGVGGSINAEPRTPALSPQRRGGQENEVGWMAILCAAFGALSFGWHPLRVESVAWATERRDVLSTAFLLGSLLWYLRAVAVDGGGPYRRALVLAWLLYVGSLLSKAMGMTLPVVLLLLDVYPLRRLPADPREWFRTPASRRILWEKIPFAVASAAAMGLAIHGQRLHSTPAPLSVHSLVARLAQSAYGLVWYCLKTLWPSDLSPLYPLDLPINPREPRFWLSGMAVIGVTLLLWRTRHRFPAVLTAWCTFAVLVSPVVGLTQSGPQIVADRYAYLPCIPWAILAAVGLWQWLSRDVTPMQIRMARLGGLAVVIVLGGLTIQQLAYWHNSYTLWRQAVQVNDGSSLAHHNLGRALMEAGKPREALEQFDRALQIGPVRADILMNRGLLRYESGRKREGVADLRLACELNPRGAMARYNLAVILTNLGDDAGGEAALQKAVALDPENAGQYRQGVQTTRRHRTAKGKQEE